MLFSLFFYQHGSGQNVFSVYSLRSNTPRLAAHLSFRRKPESREKQAGCRIRSGMTKNT